VERFAAIEGGDGLHFVMEPTGSPLLISLIDRVQTRLPGARFHFHAPLRTGSVEEGSRRALGEALATHHRFERARIVLAIDSDFLVEGPFQVRQAHDFAARRRVQGNAIESNRLYVAEGDLTATGAIADHRLRVRPSDAALVLAAVATQVQASAGNTGTGSGQASPPAGPKTAPGPTANAWATAVARDLLLHRGESIVVVGDRQPPEAHALAHALNALLGNVGNTVFYTAPVLYDAGSHGLADLVAAIDAGQVRQLVLLDVDPVYDAYADLDFATRLARVPSSICLALRETATARACTDFIPGLHWLEAWGDGRSYDGTLTVQQPLIQPLYAGRSPAEVLAAFAGEHDPDAHGLLRTLYGESGWDRTLQLGFVPDTAYPPVTAEVDPRALSDALAALAQRESAAGMELSLRTDPKLRDGRFGLNDWLLELPDPITRLSWDNAALLSPATAARLGVHEGELLELRAGDRVVQAPAMPVRGIADETITLRLGWGQTHPGEGVVGTDGYLLRTAAAPSFVRVEMRSLGQTTDLASVQPHIEMEDRAILLRATLDQSRADPHFVAPHDDQRPSLYPPPPPKGPQWGMSIDLSTCTGCASCVIACQAENNTPVVGKIGVRKGRAMHWLRIDRYLLGKGDDDVQLLPQPMLCQHCENAPCEYVCPVNATVHSPDGLNEMVYNRCIGTRFCSNNCPYKVRRFNWLEYNEPLADTQKMQKNPNVTVRARGVMEKCTYCVQRIRTEGIAARIEGRAIREVQTACQAACPTDAIVFGLVSDPASAVSRLHGESRSYGVLQYELGTAPRTRYLAHLRNTHPELES
jgi:molybdopterin-containing oxidoreductase family iron-sulfur binding subunit